MAVRLRPVDSTFFTLLGESAGHLCTGAALLAEMLGETSDRADVAARMREAEHAADETTHALVRRIATTFVTPLPREDLFDLAAALDDVMDAMDAAVDLLLLHEAVTLPADASPLVDVITRCAEVTAGAMPRLQGLRGLEDYWIEIGRLEDGGERLQRRAVAGLMGGGLKALEALRLTTVVDALALTIDGFEHVADTVQRIVVKES